MKAMRMIINKNRAKAQELEAKRYRIRGKLGYAVAAVCCLVCAGLVILYGFSGNDGLYELNIMDKSKQDLKVGVLPADLSEDSRGVQKRIAYLVVHSSSYFSKFEVGEIETLDNEYDFKVVEFLDNIVFVKSLLSDNVEGIPVLVVLGDEEFAKEVYLGRKAIRVHIATLNGEVGEEN